MSLNQELMDNPVGFAKKYCILGGDKALTSAVDQRTITG